MNFLSVESHKYVFSLKFIPHLCFFMKRNVELCRRTPLLDDFYSSLCRIADKICSGQMSIIVS